MLSHNSTLATISSPRFKKPSHNACLSCRLAKIKCKATSIHETCERCLKNSLDCAFEVHRRGRKPGTRLKKKGASVPHSSSVISQGVVLPTITPPLPPSNEFFTPPVSNGNDEDSISPESGGWGTAGLQPVSILSKEAQSGKFSLENILCVPDVSESEPSRPPPAYGPMSTSQDDPIEFHILTFPVALGLFESFMRCMNPSISQLDPKLHTFEYIRQKSPFLLTTILSASSKAFHPSLHPALRAHSEKLMGETFVKGTKSAETVQGLLIFTYWKEPNEMRTWLLVGYAIRMAIELGWHILQPRNLTDFSDVDEITLRESRNIERTWLVLFVYDRSLSLQLGKPWMIEQSEIILTRKTWHKHPLAVPGSDLVLTSFVSLRIVSAEMLQLATQTSPASNSHSDLMSKMLNNAITAWELSWLPSFDHDSISPCHRFLANFYGLHLRLLLNSYSLQASLAADKNGSLISRSALWHCSSSAIGMLEQISVKFGPFKQLYFVQDSIHVMVAYAAVFLIKLLISLPKHIRCDFEKPSLQAIIKSADMFEHQCATQMTGCAMQARFLRSVIRKYDSLKSQASANNSHARVQLDTPEHYHAASNSRIPTGDRDMRSSFNNINQRLSESQDQDVLGMNLFADKDLWDNLFSDVDFWIGEGISLSDNTIV